MFPRTRGRTSRLPATVKSAGLTPASRRKPFLLYGGRSELRYYYEYSTTCLRSPLFAKLVRNVRMPPAGGIDSKFRTICPALFNFVAVLLGFSQEFAIILYYIIIYYYIPTNATNFERYPHLSMLMQFRIKIIVAVNITFYDQLCKYNAALESFTLEDGAHLRATFRIITCARAVKLIFIMELIKIHVLFTWMQRFSLDEHFANTAFTVRFSVRAQKFSSSANEREFHRFHVSSFFPQPCRVAGLPIELDRRIPVTRAIIQTPRLRLGREKERKARSSFRARC